MTHAQLRQFIEARIAANWTSTPVTYDNLDYAPAQGASWVRVTILDGAGNRISLGASGANVALTRFVGVVVVSIFTPGAIGTATARAYADTLDTLFRDVSADGIIYGTPYLTAVGRSEGWYQLNITIPFQWDDVR